MEDEKAVEIIERELETAPEQTGIVGGALTMNDQLALADNIGKLVEAQNKIRMTLLKLAQKGDWVLFGKDNQAKAELGYAGAMRVGSTLGVSFTNWSAEKETGADDKGQWFRWNYECDAEFRGRSLRVYGRASSRDKFFGKAYGEFKAIEDVNEGDIRMAARRGAMKEGVKALFGLHHMDPSVLTQYGISLEGAGGHDFKSREDSAQETKTLTTGIESVTVKKGGTAAKPWTKYLVQGTEGDKFNTFSKSFAEVAKAAKESGEQVTIHYITNDFGNEIKAIDKV